MILISIPTRGRPGFVKDVCLCLGASICQEFIVVFTGNSKSDYPDDIFEYNQNKYIPLVLPEKSVIACHNFVFRMMDKFGCTFFLPCSDDVLFYTNSLSNYLEDYEKLFPGGDGCLGIQQKDMPNGKDSAFMLMGRGFLNHLNDDNVFYDGYSFFYADTELGNTAKYYKKFAVGPNSFIFHRHPETGRVVDSTHIRSRTYLVADSTIYFNRLDGVYLDRYVR